MAHFRGRAARLLSPLLLALVAAGSPLAGAVAGSAASLAVTPSTGLPAVALVSVDADGLAPHTTYLLAQCPADPPSFPCDNQTAVEFTTDGNGDAFDVEMTVNRRYVRELDQTYEIDCLDVACELRTVAGGASVSAAITFAKIATTTSFTVTRNARKLLVSGRVRPTHEPVDEDVSVLLDRRRKGAWRRIAANSAELYVADGATRFATSFGRRSGTCRITVKYAGTHRYARSKSVLRLAC